MMREFNTPRLALLKRAMMLGAMAVFIVVVVACSSNSPAPGGGNGPGPDSSDEAQLADEANTVGELEVPEFDVGAFAEINPIPEIRALIREADLRGEFDYYEEERIPRDAINPVYTPKFVSPDEATLNPKELVMGLEINGDARAYPVGMMRIREMVNDEVGGTPVLVTW